MKKQSTLYSAGILSAANMAIRIAGFMYRVWLTRHIGAEAMGIYQMAIPLISLGLTMVSSGIPIAVSRACARQPKQAHSLVKSAFYIECCIALPLTLMIMAFSSVFAHLYGDVRTQLPMILLAPSILFIGLKNAYEGYFLGQRNTLPSALSEMLDQGIRILFTVILLKLLQPLPPTLAASVAAAGTSIGEGLSFMVVYLHYRKVKTPAKAIGGKLLFDMAWPVTGGKMISSAIQSLTSMAIPPLLLASGLDQSQSAQAFGIVMGMAFPLIFLPSTVFSGLTTVLIPSLSCVSVKTAGEKIRNAMEVCSLLSFFFACVLTVCAPYLGTLLYHEPEAGVYMRFIAPFSALIGIQLIASASLNGLGLQKKALINQCIGNSLMLTLSLCLTANPHLRMYGYLIGYCVNLTVTTLLNVITCIRHTRMRFSLSGTLLLPLLAFGVTYAVAALVLGRISGMNTFFAFVLALTLSVTCFLLCALALGLHKPAIAYFRQKTV